MDDNFFHNISRTRESVRQLRTALEGLPGTIPFGSSHYSFIGWEPNPEDVENYGTAAAALNRELEVTFAPSGRADDSSPYAFLLLERGPGLTAVADVLASALQAAPDDEPLKKWLNDFWRTVAHYYSEANKPLPPQHNASTSNPIDPSTTGDPDNVPPEVIDPCDYVDVPEPEKGVGGRPVDPRLVQLAIRCYKANDPDRNTTFRCVGTSHGCKLAWSSQRRIKVRILAHAAQCEHLPAILRSLIDKEFAESAPTARLLASSTPAPTPSPSLSPTPSPPLLSTLTSTSSKLRQSSIAPVAKKARIEQLTRQLDADIVHFICVAGIAPAKVGLDQWKAILAHAAPEYTPASPSKLEQYQIPAEASLIRTKQLEELRQSSNLCITFDGQTIRRPQSVYTVHIITPARAVYFFKGHEASDESHTAMHLFQMLDEIITHVGPSRFAGICSDNTGNTRVARRKIQEKFPWIINIPDSCHHINLLIQDICRLEVFAEEISVIRRTNKFFSKSTFANSKLKDARTNHGVSRGLDVNHKFADPDDTLAFQLDLATLLTVIGPAAKATKCLESSFATAADTYTYWIAIQASIEELSLRKNFRLPREDVEQIRRLCNYQFDQLINNAPSDIFVTAFFLIPGNRDSGVLRNVNPLAVPPVVIRRGGTGIYSASSGLGENETLKRIGAFLVSQLRLEYVDKKEQICSHNGHTALTKLNNQVLAYANGTWPFNKNTAQVTNENVSQYWQDFLTHDDADVLAYLAKKIFDISVNSMADERTASTMAWMNSPHRNAQKSSTLVNQIQIRQWDLMHAQNAKKPVQKPTLRFSALRPDLGETEITHGLKRPRCEDDSETSTATDSEDILDTADTWLDEDTLSPEEKDQIRSEVVTAENLVGYREVNMRSAFLTRFLDLLSDKPQDSGTAAVRGEDNSRTDKGKISGPEPPITWEFGLP
ncbi:hypothetical protein CONPUDRAFT_159670 [Coniophora puteana RWD-64-598 SS2]|uniref:DUF659 domain-containing protein n=1 Tax=Coniophora puteana (strain RWD-64-598) TaxID=741705 RepID=A0A5M3M7L7_CONPW|nr:uncharacterized protein CONPUDRAFT_159670 [Coniophora puteana RWD-64-598 SS2]EIW74896.1 hypothetical protein CONPUDRAFT_159670 [Coniophora puteana RWD-64-598 SS2]